jgi:hypothetical protein
MAETFGLPEMGLISMSRRPSLTAMPGEGSASAVAKPA